MGKTRSDMCSLSTIPASINLLNSELNILDFKQISRNDKDDKATLVQLINVCYELTKALKRNCSQINQQFEELARYQLKVKSELKEKERLQTLLANETRKVEDFRVKLDNNNSKMTVLNSQIKSIKTNVSQLQHAISVQKLRHEHDSRRKDATISGLKKTLYQSYSNESGMSSDKCSAARPNTVLSQQYDEILDRYVCQLHNNIQIVLGENAKYRTLLESMHEKLSVELIDCPEAVWQQLTCLPCHSAVKAMEKTFNMFLKRMQEKEEE
uniref:Afadin-and alpha-actinin-binding protein n=1 Tax=Lygus hesperus TaxID=30085 RepID=A0A0A9ZBJ6_LYGHE